MLSHSPAQVFALVAGAVLVAAGALGFFYEAAFESGETAARARAFGVLEVNGWHNVLHVATGAGGLLLAGSWRAARAYAVALGAVYALAAAAGLAGGEELLGIVPVNTGDNVLYALIGLSGLVAGEATPAEPPPTLAVR
jgi:hypothetical protein